MDATRELRPVQEARSEDLDEVRKLFREYQMEAQANPCFVNLENELASLPGEYAPPRGRLLVCFHEGQAAGCVALRPVDDKACELKRFFVRPAFRKLGYGQLLLHQAIETARSAGYQRIVLDTLPSMQSAQKMYERAGFADCAPWRDVPICGARDMSLDLVAAEREGPASTFH